MFVCSGDWPNSPTRYQQCTVKVRSWWRKLWSVAHREGKSASDDLMGLTFSLATWNRGRAEVCGLRHVCVWMQERWKVRARVCNCVHESWSTNTFFCNLHSEWDLLCTSNVDHSTFQTKDFVYIGAFFGHSSWLFATKVWLTHTWKTPERNHRHFYYVVWTNDQDEYSDNGLVAGGFGRQNGRYATYFSVMHQFCQVVTSLIFSDVEAQMVCSP